MTASETGIGVVGLGGMGQLHAESLRDLGADVVAGADLVAKQRQQFADEFGARTYDDHEKLVADDAVDAIVIATPNRFHEPIAVAALEAGHDVLVEKPLAHTLESARRIAEAEAEADAFCMVGFHNRHTAATAMLEAQKAQGRFGELTHVEANYIRRRGVPDAGSWFTNPDLAGGGALIDIGVHALDLALYALDFPEIEEVTGVTRSTFGDGTEYADPDDWGCEPDTYEVDDSVTAFVRCADGRTISLEAAWASNRESTSEVVVQGTDAGARFELGDSDLSILEAGTAGVDHYADVELTGDPSQTGYATQDGLFLEAVATGETPSTNTIEQALTVQRVVDAIYRSSETGHTQRLAAEPIEESPARIRCRE
ncbi:Gfo/Idh/MocA family protein [Natrialbaceae archaeon AArc-T1-2]|uniref:Gfo/Idh/MocA family protein n=1 Tax=Natrialbaceae archaeon AArc-T1-2 TaxID=3053904 RepID=UPI00255B383F|nr:Gfo/Idh/MocA family oxidoreductase [Natrialbaceae archaeon AArc-T1-2]WIV66627.1 Gfo/Idh/MocA family oxidoreductase [Natrialbaceae archaeon AArc-T1-2]